MLGLWFRENILRLTSTILGSFSKHTIVTVCLNVVQDNDLFVVAKKCTNGIPVASLMNYSLPSLFSFE